MEIILNGNKYNLEDGCSVARLVAELGLDSRKIAVEKNLEIVSRSRYVDERIQGGDRIEIVNFIGGG